MRKRIIAFTFFAVMLLNTFGGFCIVNAQEDSAGTFAADVKTLVSLGIMREEITDPDSRVTRAEFISAVAGLANMTNMGGASFNDLGQDNEWYSGVAAAAAGGLVCGDGNGNIRPDDEITTYEAGIILLHVLGYTDAGTPRIPDVSPLLSSTRVLGSAVEITQSSMVKIFMDMLERETVQVSFVGADSAYSGSGMSVLEDYHNIFKTEGILKAVGEMSIDGQSQVGRGAVWLGNSKYDEGSVEAEDYIGQKVKCYYKHDGDFSTKTLLTIEGKSNTILTLKPEEVERLENNRLSYKEDGRTRTISTNANFDVIYNRRCDAGFKPEDLLEIDNGEITLIDNDGDKKYDVMLISEYDIRVVSGVDSINEVVYYKYVEKDNYKLSVKGNRQEVELVNSAGYSLDIRELANGDVLCIYESRDGSYLRAVLCVEDITGTVSSTEIEDGRMYAVIGGIRYRVASSCAKNQSSYISPGSTALFILDACGNIAYADNVKSGEQYAYAITGRRDEENDTIRLRLLLENGSTGLYEVKDKCMINGQSKSGTEEIWLAMQQTNNGKFDHQLVICKIDEDNKVTYIKTKDWTTTWNPLERWYTHYTYDEDGTAKEIDQATIGVYRMNYKNDGIIGHRVAMSEDTVVMVVPNSPDVTDADKYTIVGADYFSNDGKYHIEAWRTDPNSYTASAVIIYDDVSSDYSVKNRDTGISVLYSVADGLNDEGDQTYKVKIFTNGVTSEYTTRDMDMLKDTYGVYKPTRGDVVRFEAANGVLKKFELLYSADKETMVADSGVTNSGRDSYDWFRAWEAYVFYRWDNYVLLKASKPVLGETYTGDNMELHSINGVGIIICDKKNNTVSTGTPDDLIGFKNTDGRECSKVVAYERYGEGRTIVIFR